MRRALTVLVLLAAAGFGLFWAATRPAGLTPDQQNRLAAHPGDPVHGEQVFWAAGCAGCHAAPGIEAGAPLDIRLVLSGGRRFESPFGVFHAPNVSPDTEHGIGGWTLEEFARAMLHGVSPQGDHYYPAFPYTTYTRARPEDIADLWAFWQELPPDPTPSLGHELSFPFTLRRGIGLWKWRYLSGGDAPATADAQLERGRYLVEALSHCAECHTPRDRFGGLDRDRWMAGGPNPSGAGRIPALPPSGWSAEDIDAYLFSGFTPSFDVVGGSMADVVAHMAQLPAEDRQAIAAYLLARAPSR